MIGMDNRSGSTLWTSQATHGEQAAQTVLSAKVQMIKDAEKTSKSVAQGGYIAFVPGKGIVQR